ncbi:MAG: C45 family autoproteolytic acyltransferase/hydolase [Limisphaerales bacterium]
MKSTENLKVSMAWYRREQWVPRFAVCFVAGALLLPRIAPAQETQTNSPAQLFSQALTQLVAILAPPTNQAPHTFTTTVKVIKAEGLPKEAEGRELDLAFQAPDHIRLAINWDRQSYVAARDGQEVWVYAPGKRFGLIGSPDKAPFSTKPDVKDTKPLGPLRLPIPAAQLALLPFLSDVTALPGESVASTQCRVLQATPKPEAIDALKLPQGTLQLWIRESDSFPLRLAYREAKGTDVQLELVNPQFQEEWPAAQWKLKAGAEDKIQTVARSHVTRFLNVAVAMMGEKVPPLGPATGERRIVAREGNGRLEVVDGTRVLVLKGTPEEMGRQHGVLMKKDIHQLVDHILFGVGVGSSFEKGEWVFGEIEAAQRRLNPFMDERYLREMDSLASAAGLPREEVRLANYFPEMFHCSGFAVYGKATADGQLYHGRILDYMRGMGLEQSAVVMVFQPDRGNAWVNVGYAGFIGSVTAMNEKHVAIGEMGGKGQGHWDGKPMAELVREVMENANTLDEAVEIMRKGPRTCEYYFVISDAKSNRAVGIAATSDRFETIEAGQSHPLLPHAIPDAVLMSAGDRYEELVRRVQADYGKLDAQGCRDLMKRPVCMTSNLHCALFEPGSLDFWVANADSQNAAAHTRFTHYNLAEILQPEKAP